MQYGYKRGPPSVHTNRSTLTQQYRPSAEPKSAFVLSPCEMGPLNLVHYVGLVYDQAQLYNVLSHYI